MIIINEHYLKLKASYLFLEIANRVSAYQKNNPDQEIIRLGIGDVTEPLPQACLDAFHAAVDEMGHRETFRGYGPEQGYDFLREAIAKNEFQSRGADISANEIFVSDGSKCDSANIQEIFAIDTKIAITDPVYPVYLDTNVMAGRTGTEHNGRFENVVYLDSTPENNYIPEIPNEAIDLIYLCFPNNPTGAMVTKEQLKLWVDYARENKAIILYDAAYVGYVRDETLPQSIYEIEGAKDVAIELRSFSKSAGFTGVRCAFTVIPEKLRASDSQGGEQPIHPLWNRRQSTKMNGVSYPVQQAAASVYTAEGQKQTRALTDYYLGNAHIIREAMTKLGYDCVGGDNSPYIWMYTGKDSWESFDLLLEKAGVVTTPGSGFGSCGEGHIRLSAFNNRENVTLAMERISDVLR
jgi:LL-diaminopimelate aminotransferase